jgi:hypothetical protein
MLHAHMYGCLVIRTISVIIKRTIQLISVNDHSCKCRYLNWFMFSIRNFIMTICKLKQVGCSTSRSLEGWDM